MTSTAKTRASDADRDRAVAALREHLAAGRLTVAEFEERMDQACAAKTLGELDTLMADLPETGPGQLSDELAYRSAGPPPTRQRAPRSIETRRGGWRAAGGAWLAISLVLLVIWLASGASGGLWFLWVALALGAVLLVRRMTGSPARSVRRSDRPRRNRRHRYDDQAGR